MDLVLNCYLRLIAAGQVAWTAGSKRHKPEVHHLGANHPSGPCV